VEEARARGGVAPLAELGDAASVREGGVIRAVARGEENHQKKFRCLSIGPTEVDSGRRKSR
jgi:hypothetical protein